MDLVDFSQKEEAVMQVQKDTERALDKKEINLVRISIMPRGVILTLLPAAEKAIYLVV